MGCTKTKFYYSRYIVSINRRVKSMLPSDISCSRCCLEIEFKGKGLPIHCMSLVINSSPLEFGFAVFFHPSARMGIADSTATLVESFVQRLFSSNPHLAKLLIIDLGFCSLGFVAIG